MASAWIKYVTSVDGLTIWCGGAGCLPPRSDAAEAMDVESDPVWAVHSAMTECSLPWQLGNNAPSSTPPTRTTSPSPSAVR